MNPKVTVIGAGSLFFGRQAIWQMVNSPHLNGGTLALVDTDERVLKRMETLARMAAAHAGVRLTVEAAADRREVLKGSDFVVLSFAKDSVRYRDIDCKISAKYGVRMCSGDTIGPGGIFRTMRELPVILDCAHDIGELCPDAFVINYINPTAVNGIALKKYAPMLKSFALCDAQHMPFIKKSYAVRAGILANVSDYTDEIDRDFDMRIAGVNHFTWLIKAEYKGRDVMPDIAEAIRLLRAKETEGGDLGAKAYLNETIGYELYQAFGYVPTVVGHTKEYVRFWQGRNTAPQEIPPLQLWDAESRYARHREMQQQVEDYIGGRKPMSDFMTAFGQDHATDVIESICGDLKKKFYVNTNNNGCVPNLPDDAFLELLCTVDKDGATPHFTGDMPLGIRGMQQLVLDTHELTADAVALRSYERLRQAMLTDPLICSVSDADAILAELFDAERDILKREEYR